MKHNLLYVNCPICGKQLINLTEEDDKYHEYWCDKCQIDIRIIEYEEEMKKNEEVS